MWKTHRRFVLGVTVGAALAGAGGAAYATIPDSGGTIHGCYKRDNGQLRVIDVASGKKEFGACKNDEVPLDWSKSPQAAPVAQGVRVVPIAICSANCDSARGLGGGASILSIPNVGDFSVLACWRDTTRGTTRADLGFRNTSQTAETVVSGPTATNAETGLTATYPAGGFPPSGIPGLLDEAVDINPGATLPTPQDIVDHVDIWSGATVTSALVSLVINEGATCGFHVAALPTASS